MAPDAFHIERPPNGGLGDIPVLVQLLNLANPANVTILAIGDLTARPKAAGWIAAPRSAALRPPPAPAGEVPGLRSS